MLVVFCILGVLFVCSIRNVLFHYGIHPHPQNANMKYINNMTLSERADYDKKKQTQKRSYSLTPSAIDVRKAYSSSAHGHVNINLPLACAHTHAKKFSVFAAGSAERKAEEVLVWAYVFDSVFPMFVIHMFPCRFVRLCNKFSQPLTLLWTSAV